MVPKVKFYIHRKDQEVENIAQFLNPNFGWDWSQIILKYYPKLRKEIEGINRGEERKKIAKKFFKKIFEEKEKDLLKISKEFQKVWDEINDEYMAVLEDILDIKWPKKDRQFIAIVSLNPVCPRDIESRSFSVFYNSNEMKVKETVVHEVLHFLWFEKWKELFPETKKEDLDAPSLSWKLSEIVPLAILSDKKVQKVFKHEPQVYKEWENIKVNGKPLLKCIQEVYDNKKDIENFIISSWDFINKNKEKLP